MWYFRLIRLPNIILALLAQWVTLFYIVKPTKGALSLDNTQIVLLMIATATLIASGNIINDMYDIAIDRINKPHKLIVTQKISEQIAFANYLLYSFIAILSSFLLSDSVSRYGMPSIFIIISFLLYKYSKSWSAIAVIGNILISILVAMVIMLPVFFETYPFLNDLNRSFYLGLFKYLIPYAGMAFLLNLSRELVKDAVDMDGDRKGGRNSLPLMIGRMRTGRVTAVILAMVIFLVTAMIYHYFYLQPFVIYYGTFCIVGPLLFLVFQLWQVDKVAVFSKANILLKIVMLLGLLSPIIIQYAPYA